MRVVDFTVTDHGTLWLFEPLTANACAHAVETLCEAPMYGFAYAVEHRYAPDIVTALLTEGFAVEVDGHLVELRTKH